MEFPFFSKRAKKQVHIVAIDLGTRTTKAIYLHYKGTSYSLVRYTIQETPGNDKALSPDLLADLLKKICQVLNAPTKTVHLALGGTHSLLRQTEMPLMSIPEMRGILKNAAEKYLQQKLEGYIYDCFILPSVAAIGTEPNKPPSKCKVMVGGAKKQLIDDLQTAAKAAGLVPDQIVPNLIGPVNALEMAEPDLFTKEVVAVVDLGFKHSTISILNKGELMLNRVVEIGGDQITAALADAMSVSYAEAEGLKVGMPAEVATSLQPLLSPLGRELRASIDFFEHQYDKTVSQVLISGGAARSEFFIQTLQSEMMAPCKNWSPVSFLELALPAEQRGDIDQDAHQLAVAVGTAVTAF